MQYHMLPQTGKPSRNLTRLPVLSRSALVPLRKRRIAELTEPFALNPEKRMKESVATVDIASIGRDKQPVMYERERVRADFTSGRECPRRDLIYVEGHYQCAAQFLQLCQ
jgi:hypothetical protein